MYTKFHVLQALKTSNYNDDPMLQECGVRIGSDFTQVEGRVLPTPKVIFLPLHFWLWKV